MYNRIINLIFLIFMLSQTCVFSQNSKNYGVYVGQEGETIIIENNSFKILSDRLNIELGQDNSIVAFGDAKFLDNDFVELNSVNHHENVIQSTIISESENLTIKDSLFIKFSFPFSGEYKIEIYIGGYLIEYGMTNRSEIKVPMEKIRNQSIQFRIFNLDLSPQISGYYYKALAFYYYPLYFMKNEHSNSLFISIPELTNKFFQYYFIKGEYARVKNGILWWRGNYYEKQ